jgi:hypothetical protein
VRSAEGEPAGVAAGVAAGESAAGADSPDAGADDAG